LPLLSYPKKQRLTSKLRQRPAWGGKKVTTTLTGPPRWEKVRSKSGGHVGAGGGFWIRASEMNPTQESPALNRIILTHRWAWRKVLLGGNAMGGGQDRPMMQGSLPVWKEPGSTISEESGRKIFERECGGGGAAHT